MNPNSTQLSITRANATFWSAEPSGGKGFYQYAVGYKEVEGKEGTWRDCEDGQLSTNPVAQGAVDSAVSFQLEIPPHGYGIIHYWIACGTSLNEVTALDAQVKEIGVEQMLLGSGKLLERLAKPTKTGPKHSAP